MSLEFCRLVYDAQLRNINTVCINSIRKEAWAGCKDGSIRVYDLNKNVFKFRSREHSGLVVRILRWHSQRLMISFGIDGAVVFWSSSALSTDKVHLGEPIFDAVIYAKRQLVVATKSGCKFFPLDAHKLTGHFILMDRMHLISPHRDFVRSLAAENSRLYSGGMNGTLVVYERLLRHSGELRPAHVIRNAHAAGILCIEPCSYGDDDESCFLATGSYDRHVKIWKNDGQLCHVVSGFQASVTGLCFIRPTQQLWIASGATNVTIVDPRTGEDVSEWTEVWQKLTKANHDGKRKNPINFLSYSNELGTLIAQTDAYYILHWFYNPLGCVLSIPCDQPMESIAVTNKEPVLIFTGDNKGRLFKWEKAGFNTLKFSQEQLFMQGRLRDTPVEWQTSHETREMQLLNIAQRQQMTPSTFITSKYYVSRQTDEHPTSTTVQEKNSGMKMLWIENLDLLVVCDERGVIYVWGYEDVETQPEEFSRYFAQSARNDISIIGNLRSVSQTVEHSSHAPTSAKKSAVGWSSRRPPPDTNFRQKSSTEIILSSPSLRSGVEVLMETPPVADSFETPASADLEKSDTFGSHDMSSQLRTAMSDWKSNKHFLNRASGFLCRFILWGHDSCVSGLDYVHDKETGQDVLISTAWDRRLITWNLKTGQIFDVCKRDKTEPKVLEEKETPGEYELVAEGQITDVSYAAQRNEVAYSSRDAHLYVRKFSTQGRKMKLIKKWHAHNGEIFQVKWVEQCEAWASCGQDGTIRLWSASDLGVRLALVQCSQPVQGLTVDRDHGWLLAAVDKELQIYETDNLKLIKKYTGHQKTITGVFYLRHLYNEPHYVTTSCDNTIKMWRAGTKPPSSNAEKKID